MIMRKVHMYIDGMVMGVNYRGFVLKHATRLGLKGYVRNIEGGVEAVAEGEEDAIDELIELCKEGPSHANVTSVTVEDEPPNYIYTDFDIRP